jgi:hypothetical protein
LLGLVLVACSAACVSVPYSRLDQRALSRPSPTTPPEEPQVERGRPNRAIDGIGWVLGLPSKIILLDRRMDNHRVSAKTEDALRAYLAYNGLTDVKVRLNEYSPGAEFRRLVRNKGECWAWRYTIGVLSWLFQTVLPGRLIGGDNYNPHTDTISIYSDIPAVALHEGGHAKDFAGQTLRGTYAFAYMLPFFSLQAEAQASTDAISYLYARGSADREKEAYKTLYPAIGTYVGGMFATDLGPLSPWYYLGVVPGHIVGRCRAAGVDEKRKWRPAFEEEPFEDRP